MSAEGFSKIIDFSGIESAHKFEQFAEEVLRTSATKSAYGLAKRLMAAET